MNKKGFTLVELLAVIAILAILVIMALPAVLRMFNSARKDSFTNEVNIVLRTARQEYLLSGGTDTTWSNAEGSTKTLSLTGNSNLRYYVKMNNEGKITKLQVSNGDFQYNVTNNAGIDVVESVDVEEITEDNQLVITPTGNGNASYVFLINDNIYNSEEEAISYATTNYNMPILSKGIMEDINAWCLDSSGGWSTCDGINPTYYDDEELCLSDANLNSGGSYTYTCSYQTISIPTNIEFGFAYNGTMHYLNESNSYETNKSILENLFGVSNCSEEEKVTNFTYYETTCTYSNYSVVLSSFGPIGARQGEIYCFVTDDGLVCPIVSHTPDLPITEGPSK